MTVRGFSQTLAVMGVVTPISWLCLALGPMPLWLVGFFVGGLPILCLLICAFFFRHF